MILSAVRQVGDPRSGSIARCPVTFNGKRELAIVEDFTHRADLYRRVERMTEADALAGLPLLLTGDAQTW